MNDRERELKLTRPDGSTPVASGKVKVTWFPSPPDSELLAMTTNEAHYGSVDGVTTVDGNVISEYFIGPPRFTNSDSDDPESS